MMLVRDRTHSARTSFQGGRCSNAVGSLVEKKEKKKNDDMLIGFTAIRYANQDIALNTGMILKEMLRYEPLARILLYSDQ